MRVARLATWVAAGVLCVALADIHAAAGVLIETDWLYPPTKGTEFSQRGRCAYPVNPRLWEVAA